MHNQYLLEANTVWTRWGLPDQVLARHARPKHIQWHDPPVSAPVTSGVPDGAVVVENPYGIETCDYWPTTANQIISALVLGLSLFGIGFLAARRIPQRPLLAAAGVTVFALLFALALQFFSRFDGTLNYFSHAGSDVMLLEILSMLVVIALGAGVAMLGAWLARVFGIRA